MRLPPAALIGVIVMLGTFARSAAPEPGTEPRAGGAATQPAESQPDPATAHSPAAHPGEAAAYPGAEASHTPAGHAHAPDPVPHPELPDGSQTWPGTTVIVILAMFLAAAIVGPIVRANMPEEVPPAHSHDEPPGASHHHGQSGTLNAEPGHGHSSGHH